MQPLEIIVKNMVCHRCIIIMEQILKKLKIDFKDITLGKITLVKEIGVGQLTELDKELLKNGFERLDDKKKKIIENIRHAVQNYLHKICESENRKNNLSDSIVADLKFDYTYLSDLFSSIEGITIEQYFIRLRIEKVKELVVYDELSFSEIAYRTGFSSIHHLSAQFKKVTGMTLSQFKKTGHRHSGMEKVNPKII